MAKDFNSQHTVDGYEAHIRKLIPGYEQLHLQILALMKAHLPAQAHVLIIGAGTGYELGYLMQAFPQAQFTVTELSENMLHKAKAYVKPWNTDNRVRFLLGQHTVLAVETEKYDAVLCILVAHFVPFEHKAQFYHAARKCLKPNGIFAAYDLMHLQRGFEAEALKQLVMLNGLSEKQADSMLQRLDDDFYALSEQDMRAHLQRAGFMQIQRFIQMLCYQGYIARLHS